MHQRCGTSATLPVGARMSTTEPASTQGDRGGRSDPNRSTVGWILLTLSIPGLLVTVLLLVLPTSTHIDTDYGGEDIFFGCGTPMTPTSEPYEEPGISECDRINDRMRAWAVIPAVGTGVVAILGALLILRRRARDRGNRKRD